jgi:hypothetical protein
MLLAVSLLAFGRTGWDKMNYTKNSQIRQRTAVILNEADDAVTKFEAEQSKGTQYDEKIQKQFEPFKHREIVPLLHQTIISALPNNKTNPEQAKLYKAFADGDVQGVKEIPRKQRKQIFLTSMSAYYTNDLAKGQFGGADLWRRSRGAPGAGGGEFEGETSEYEYQMMMESEYGAEMMGMYAPGFMPGAQTTEEKKQGFVVTIVGYSPYGDSITQLGELMDPHGVEDRSDKWGFVTRLAHLDAMVEDGNSPFVLYEKTNPEQFKLEIKEVTLDGEMPEGIGVWQEQTPKTPLAGPRSAATIEWALADPMTNEIINKVAELDENRKQRIYRGTPVFKGSDHWFVLNVKFVWKDAPEPPKQTVMSPYGMPMPTAQPSSPSAAPASPPSSRPSGRKSSVPDMDM